MYNLGDVLTSRNDQYEKNESSSTDKTDRLPIVDNIVYTEDEVVNKIDVSKLENFLHPNSGSLRRIIEDRVIKQPKILSEMLSVDFNDLITVFQHLFRQHKSKLKTVEEIYTDFLNLIEEEGSEGIRRYVDAIKNDQNRYYDMLLSKKNSLILFT